MNIAVVVNSSLESGGGYQYEYMVLDILKKYHNIKDIELKYYTQNKKVLNDYSDLKIDIIYIKENILSKILRFLINNIYFYKIVLKLGYKYTQLENKLEEDNIDLIYFLSPNSLSYSILGRSYIFTLWDLGHLDALEFPEVSYNMIFERRELLYSKALKKAFKTIVDSNYGKNNAIKKYNLDENRIESIKYLPNIKIIDSVNYVDIKIKYNLKYDYIFYPAQFWAHKNHIYILDAIKILKEDKNININVIFSGSNKGNLDYILTKAKEYNIEELINYIGFAPNEEIPYLYKQSLALVMPTYLGPTNIPPLEAFAYGTPVCYSDTPFFREQVENAVFFMDLKNPKSLVNHIITIQQDKLLVEEKIKKGKNILENWNEKDFYNKLKNIFLEYKTIRKCWK